LSEKIRLLADRKILEQDLNDIVTDYHALEEAYINELRMSLETASSSKERLSGIKTPKLDRKIFKRQLNEYLGTEDIFPGTTDTRKWCNVIGAWLPSNAVTCAHIVPFSFNTEDMAHMFGSDEPPLTSMRNGLSLQKRIEEAFNNCWVAVVPVDSVESNPIDWKIILLNTAEKDNVFFGDQFNQTSQKTWRWRDIDGRKLRFLNNNRPARRFLYMRYTLAWLHAEARLWNFKEKVPAGEVWASSNKPNGYLRKSILVAMGKKTGDKLPKDLIDAGAFSDPDTGSIVYDEVAGIRITRLVQGHLDGIRDSTGKKNEDNESEGEKNQEETVEDD
jgi:HNH endonuclease